MLDHNSDNETLLTKKEVARICRVAVRTIDRWLEAGKVGCQRTPSGRVLFRTRDVLTVSAHASPGVLRCGGSAPVYGRTRQRRDGKGGGWS
jgi:hypothetical protein